MSEKCWGSANCTRSAKSWHRGLCWKHYEADQRRRIAAGEWEPGWEPVENVVAHIDMLLASGLSYRRIAELSGLTQTGVYMMRSRKRIRSGSAKRIYSVAPLSSLESSKSGYVPIIGFTRRLQALVAMGYTQVHLAELVNLSPDQLLNILYGKRQRVQIATAKRIDKVYQELQLKHPAPSYGRSRSLSLAKRRGWYPPLAWDEDMIDDPTATPDLGTSDKLDWVHEYGELLDFGLSREKALERLSTRLGIEEESLKRRLLRLTA